MAGDRKDEMLNTALTRTKLALTKAGFATVAAAMAAAATIATATVWAGGAADDDHSSGPDFVAPACTSEHQAAACRVALQYLSALDLDRGRQACALLAPGTRDAAGGMEGCAETIAAKRGIRIRYSLLAVDRTSLGTSIRFTTQGESDSPIVQVMLVSPTDQIIAVTADFGYRGHAAPVEGRLPVDGHRPSQPLTASASWARSNPVTST